jgi:hypothetical protein
MPETIEPTPERPQAEARDRDDDGLSTASLAQAADRRPEAGSSTRSFADGGAADAERPDPLFGGDETSNLRKDWNLVQASFVDEPRRAVEDADRLVASAIKRMAEMFADEKAKLDGQWDRGGDVSTEDLRQALRRYRSFFERVLSV